MHKYYGFVALTFATVVALAMPARVAADGHAAATRGGDAPGRYVVAPAGHTPLVGKTLPAPVLFSAWVLDTQSGAVKFCTYNGGGVVIGTTVTPEMLNCTPESQ